MNFRILMKSSPEVQVFSDFNSDFNLEILIKHI